MIKESFRVLYFYVCNKRGSVGEYPPHFFGASKIFLLRFCFVTGPSVDLNPLGDESH